MNNSTLLAEEAPASEVRSGSPRLKRIGGVLIRVLLALAGLGLGAVAALVIGLYAGWIGIGC